MGKERAVELPRISRQRLTRSAVGFVLAIAASLGFFAAIPGDAQQPLTSLRAIHALTNTQASHQLPVSFEATITYYRAYERTLFVQDGDLAIYVQPQEPAHLSPGDRVLIKGTTHESFRPFVSATSITVVGHGSLPTPARATFQQLIRAEFDCRLVTVRATVRNVDLVQSSDTPSVSVQMRSDSGQIDAIIDSDDVNALKNILDSEIEFTGAVSGHSTAKCR